MNLANLHIGILVDGRRIVPLDRCGGGNLAERTFTTVADFQHKALFQVYMRLSPAQAWQHVLDVEYDGLPALSAGEPDLLFTVRRLTDDSLLLSIQDRKTGRRRTRRLSMKSETVAGAARKVSEPGPGITNQSVTVRRSRPVIPAAAALLVTAVILWVLFFTSLSPLRKGRTGAAGEGVSSVTPGAACEVDRSSHARVTHESGPSEESPRDEESDVSAGAAEPDERDIEGDDESPDALIRRNGGTDMALREIEAESSAGTKGATAAEDEGAYGSDGETGGLRRKTTRTTHDSGVEERDATAMSYRIIPGDTMWWISTRYYGTPQVFEHLAEINRIADPDLIISGDTMVLPEEVANRERQ